MAGRSRWPDDEDRALLHPILAGLCVLLVGAGLNGGALADPRRGLLVALDGPIGPAISDYVVGAIARAEDERAEFVILRMNTPGGLDSAMRAIVQKILASRVPVITYVAPSGGRAASAGTYILYASHLAAMAPATNLGAATPIQIAPGPFPGGDRGERRPQDTTADNGKDPNGTKSEQRDQRSSESTLDRKVVNDAVAYIRGLAIMRGRNAAWAELAVREAASLTAEEAAHQRVIEIVAKDVDALLRQLDGRQIEVLGQTRTVVTQGLALITIEPDWRSRLLAIITDPNVAYILLLLGIYGLFFELANPGLVLPGVAGAIALLLAFYAFQVLPVSYAGLALIALGVAFMVGEAFAPSLGALGIGGTIAFIIGSLILMDSESQAFSISLPLIAALATSSGAFFIGIGVLALRNRRRLIVSGAEQMIGVTGEAMESFADRGWVRVHGEIWTARTAHAVLRGDAVRVRAIDGLVLDIEPANREN